jgi:acyl-CoA reductase-like NAD-dependent aldehyde dehydrogenase
MTAEIGKPTVLALAEVDRGALVFDLAADLLTQPAGRVLPADYDGRGDGLTITEERFPIGPWFCITPYNWPVMLAAHKIAPALAAGSTVVVKGSPLSPVSSLALGRVLHEAGVPAGVVNFIQCEAALAEKAVKDPRTAAISFTGSEGVGWHIKGLVPRKKVLLELGGDASAIVLADAELARAIPPCVKSAFGYAGQVCISLQHMLIEQPVWEEGCRLVAEETEKVVFGDPAGPGAWCGPMITSEAADRVMAWIDEAEQAGAAVLAGGSRIGNVVQPTVLAHVPEGLKLTCEEAFGPVLILNPVQSLDEAISRVNSSRYGIHASIFTQSQRAIQKAFRELEVGGVVANDAPNTRFDGMPYGGIKASGFGREGCEAAMLEMTEPRVLVHRWA